MSEEALSTEKKLKLCRDCAFYGGHIMRCQKNAPLPPSPTSMCGDAVFPPMMPDGFCGEWQPLSWREIAKPRTSADPIATAITDAHYEMRKEINALVVDRSISDALHEVNRRIHNRIIQALDDNATK